MAFPGNGVAPNICRREYMAEHFYRLRAIFATLACEGANSKLFDVVTVADVDDEDRVGNSLLQISKLRFGQKAKLLFRL